jgi:hypothetical protein
MTSDYSPTSVAILFLGSNRPCSFQHSPIPKALARMARAMAANAGAVLGDGEEEAEEAEAAQ